MFDDIKACIEANEKLSPIVTELLIRGRKLNISLVFMWQSYFKVSKIYKTKCKTLFYDENT